MAVFEFRGVAASTGKVIRGVRDAENAKMLRAALRRDGIVLTSATEGGRREVRRRRATSICSSTSAGSAPPTSR